MATKVKLIETGAVTGNIIPDGGIATGKLANDAVTTIKITDANITHAKLHTSMDLTGKTVTVATASGSTNTTAAASTAFVQQELTTLIGGAPSTLNDLNELAAAINDDANYNSTLTTALATKLPLAGGTMTGALDVGGTITGDDGLSIQGGTGNAYLQVGSDTGSWTWKNYRSTHKLALEDSDGTGEVLNFDTSGNATFAGIVTAPSIQAASGSFSIKRSNDGTNAVQVLATGEVLIGANYLYVTASAGAYFSNAVRFRGTISNDTGTNVTFGQAINVTGHIKVGGTTVIDSSRNITAGDVNITSAAPTIFFTDSDGTNQNTTVKQSGGNFFIIARDNTANAGVVFAGNAGGTYDEYARFKADGNFGIRTNNPSETLELTRLGKIGFGMNGSYGARIGYFDDGGGVHGFHVDTKHAGTTVSESRFVVRAESGNVGIGTKNPAFKLVVSHNGRNGMEFVPNTDDAGTNIIQNYNRGTAAYTPLRIAGNSLTLLSGTNAQHSTSIDTSGHITTSGKVGVGMTPVEVLDLKASSGDTRLRLDAASGSDTEIKFFNDGAAQYTIGHDDATDNFVIGSVNVDTPLISISKAGNISLNGGGTIEAPSVGGGETLTLKAAGGITAIIDSNGNGGDDQFFSVQKHTGDNLLTVQETGAVEVTGTLNSSGALSTTASVGVAHFFKSTYSYGPNRDWAIRTNNYGSTNWGGWSLEQSGEAQGTPDIARIGVHANGNVGIKMGGAAGTGGTENPATPLHVGGDITVGTAESVGTSGAAAIRFVNDNERSRITSNYASGGGGQMGFWTDSTGGTLLQRTYIKNDGSFNFNGPVKMHSNVWNTNDVLRAYTIGGPSSNSLTRTINVNTYWGFGAQGGAFMFMIHGWQSDSATGMVHWHNNGSNNPVITGVYLNEFHTATGLTVSVAKGTGDYDIDISLASTHSNTHGWYWKVWA